MIIGVPSEVKNNENRVGLTPDSAKKIVASGHDVLIQKNAGASIGFFDEQYLSAGAKILDSAEDVYKSSEMIVKVKEPIPEEYPFLRDDLTLFTYLHLAGDPENAKKLIDERNKKFGDKGDMGHVFHSTTLIGDPSGKDETRKILTEEEIRNNANNLKAVFDKYLSFKNEKNNALIMDNADWLDKLGYVDFLRDFGKHFTINKMLTFDSVKLRLDREQSLSYMEFNYMILQAYDLSLIHISEPTRPY